MALQRGVRPLDLDLIRLGRLRRDLNGRQCQSLLLMARPRPALNHEIGESIRPGHKHHIQARQRSTNHEASQNLRIAGILSARPLEADMA